ncbi:hypothetical protein [Ensifer canadensis]
MYDDRREPLAVRELDDEDMAALLAALAGGSSRVERCQLKDRTVWIMRYQRLGLHLGLRTQWLASRLAGVTFLRITAFSAVGGPTALVLSHRGMPVATARARDVWRLFLQIASRALKPDTRFVAATDYLAGTAQSQS